VRRERGFTLLEMIVATLIMSIAVVGMLSGLAGATRNASRLRDYERVAQVARLQMNELIADPKLKPDFSLTGTFDPALTGGLEAGWQATVTNFEQFGEPHKPLAGELVLDRFMLQVWWMNGSLRRTFNLETVRQRTVAPEPPQ
jgi:general secretion pathway protein I